MKNQRPIEGWEDYKPITIKLIPFEPQPEPVGMEDVWAKGAAALDDHRQKIEAGAKALSDKLAAALENLKETTI